MDTRLPLHHLGQNILVVMDGAPHFLDQLRSVCASIPQVSDKFFTLIGCCPPRYWEHGGADNPEVKQEIIEAWKEEVSLADHAEQCLQHAKAALTALGVPETHIVAKISAEGVDVTSAVMRELNQCQYSGVIVSRYHIGLVNRLHKTGITDVFRQIPKVEVLAIDVN
jgi:hypothetical protein